MTRLVVPLVVLTAAYALFFGYTLTTYAALPPKVASHFDGHGRPDGWMSRTADTEIMSAVALFVPGLVIAFMGGASRIPVSFINLPHRDYWLAPERRKAALAALRCYAIWFAALNVLFLTGAQFLIVHANLPAPHTLDMTRFTTGVIAYLVFTAIWTLLLLRRFSKV